MAADIDGGAARLPGAPAILLVEDDCELAQEVVAELASRGYAASHIANGLDAIAAVRVGAFDAAGG
jgi:DNA-binding response OmpR family regulator